MQSGKEKGMFISNIVGDHAHTAEVTGLGLDSLNKFLISSSLDSSIKHWDFYRRTLLKTFSSEYPIDNLVYNRLNDLVAFTSTNLSLTIINARSNLKKVREFKNAATNKITDICFSQPDSKWMICSSLDKGVRCWDIITGALVDWVQFK